MTLTPIETSYKGVTFRSRLEARWAVFFDELHVRWLYEPEGFVLPSGARYLPDFFLPDFNYWIEIKPELIEDRRHGEFMELVPYKHFIVIFGRPDQDAEEHDDSGGGNAFCWLEYWLKRTENELLKASKIANAHRFW